MLLQIWASGTSGIILAVLLFIFLLLFITIFLKIGLGFVDADKREFGSVFVTSLICAIIIVILFIIIPSGIYWLIIAILVGLLICWAIIANRHDIGYGSAIVVTILAVIAAIIIIFLILFIIGSLIGFYLWAF